MAVAEKKQEVISNNLANSNTTGFKKDTVHVRSFADELLAQRGKGQSVSLGDVGNSPVLDSIITNFSPGTLLETGRTLDLALDGDAFFVLETPNGVRYTKDGSFTLDRDGFLVSSDGYRVLAQDGSALQIRSDQVAIDSGGTIRDLAGTNQVLGRIGLATFAADDLATLEKRGQNLFEAVGIAPQFQEVAQVRQGMLENANLEVIREMVDMIGVMRTYEANQKALQAHDEILGKSINEVGRLR